MPDPSVFENWSYFSFSKAQIAFCKPETLNSMGSRDCADSLFSRGPAFIRILGCKERSKEPLSTGPGLNEKGNLLKGNSYFLDSKGRNAAGPQTGLTCKKL